MRPRRTFQIEFAPGSDPRWGLVRGRVEHVAWGDGTRFDSLAELLRFIGVTLRAMEGPSGRRRRGAGVAPVLRLEGSLRSAC